MSTGPKSKMPAWMFWLLWIGAGAGLLVLSFVGFVLFACFGSRW